MVTASLLAAAALASRATALTSPLGVSLEAHSHGDSTARFEAVVSSFQSLASRRGLLNDDEDDWVAQSVRIRRVASTAGWVEASDTERARRSSPSARVRRTQRGSSANATVMTTRRPLGSERSSSPFSSPSNALPSSSFRRQRQAAMTPFESPYYVRGSHVGEDMRRPSRDQPRQAEVAPGSVEPVQVPFTFAPPTFWPAFAGPYSTRGPFAEDLNKVTIDPPFGSDYSFGPAFVVYPKEVEDASNDRRYPVVAWGVGAHNGCEYVDNQESMEHMASWGLIVVCPEAFPEPYLGDEALLIDAMRFIREQNFDLMSPFSGRIKLDGIGMAGYSLGGGRVVRSLTTIEARREEADVISSAPASSSETMRADVAGTSASARGGRRGRALLGGTEDNRHRCVDASCQLTLCHAAVSLQGWNEGTGSATPTPLLVLTAETDDVAGPWRDRQYPLFTQATGRRLMGVVANGPHNLGPHYWLGWTTAFLLGGGATGVARRASLQPLYLPFFHRPICDHLTRYAS